MKIIKRTIEDRILESMAAQKVVVVLGARRIGKTVSLGQVMKRIDEPYLLLNGENIVTLELLERRSVQNYRNLLGEKRILIIDEAQKIPEIGKVLKLMVDEIEGLKILVTGSSAFDISNQTGEPLTGRKTTIRMYPLSEEEILREEEILEHRDNLRQRLIFGNYPEPWQKPEPERKREYLEDLVNSYLFKDVLALENIRNAPQLVGLLRLIAYQIGQEVSLNELGRQLGISKNTVEKYLDLFAKTFILFKIGGFSRNMRKEVVKSSKWYFFDNGLRNAVINDFSPINLRQDLGQLWENYVLSERLKFQEYHRTRFNNYFWRTYDQQEIDWVEERDGKLAAYEMKWNPKRKATLPSAWRKAYPDASFKVITPDNYLEWVTG